MKIGDTIWTRDSRDSRKGWEEYTITGETKISWLIQADKWSKPHKVNKETMLENLGQWGAQRWYSVEQKEQKEYIDANRRNISNAILSLEDVQALKAIDTIVRLAQ